MPSPTQEHKRLPKGLGRVAEAYWDDIEANLEDVLESLGEPVDPQLSPLELVDPKRGMFGCGKFGCVYPLSNTERWVLKLTLDPTEGPIINAIMANRELREHPGIVYYADVARLPSRHRWRNKDYDVWVVLRENVSPYEWKKGWKDWPEFNQTLLEVREHAEDFGRAMARVAASGTSRGRKRRMDDAGFQWEDAVYELESEPPGEAISAFMQLFWKRYCGVLADVHLANVGWPIYDLGDVLPGMTLTPGLLKIFDPGHSYVCEDFESKLLGLISPNPRVKVIGR